MKKLLTFICLTLIILNIFAIAIQFNTSGGDYNIYLSSLKSWETGGNPYLIQNIQNYYQTYLTFVYPPITLIAFKFLLFSQNKLIYYFYWILALILTFLIIRKTDENFQPLLFATLLITGFTATLWNFINGNIGLIQLVIFALAIYYLIKKNSYYISAILITLLGFIKIIPLVLNVLFLFAPLSWTKKIKIITVIVIVFASLSALSWFLFPKLTIYYYLSITGGLAGQSTPLIEPGGMSNPASFFLLQNISNILIAKNLYLTLILYGSFVTFILAIFVKYLKKANRHFLEIFLVGTLAIFLIIPQMKPYTFTLAIIPVYFLIRNQDINTKIISLLIVSFLPLIEINILMVLLSLRSSLLGYIQIISLLIFFLYYCFIIDRKIPRDSKAVS